MVKFLFFSFFTSLLLSKELCYQTAELYNNIWYELTDKQKLKTQSLIVDLHSKDYIIIEDQVIKYIGTHKDVDIYLGYSLKNKQILIGTILDKPHIYHVTVGNLHPKEFKCHVIK